MAGRSRGTRAVNVLGELLITVGVLVGLFVFYLLYWTGVSTGRVQSQASDDLRSAWAAEAELADGGSAASADGGGAPGDPAVGTRERWG